MRSKLAIASFVLGLISLVYGLSFFIAIIFPSRTTIMLLFVLFPYFGIFILAGIVGAILGIISIFIIKNNNLEGMKYAIIGIVFSLIGDVGILFIVFAMFSSIGSFL